MIRVAQAINPRSMISSRFPSMNLKKRFSFSKKACPKNVPFIKKYRMDAVVPIAGVREKFRFKKIKKIIANETVVKRSFSSRAIRSCIITNRDPFFIFLPPSSQ